jgi:hypothetical protein
MAIDDIFSLCSGNQKSFDFFSGREHTRKEKIIRGTFQTNQLRNQSFPSIKLLENKKIMNGVVTIPITSLNPQSIPANLNGLIDPNQWSHICTALVNRKGDSFCMTCAIEFGICCITGFFCIFCCHGCLENVVQQGTLEG